MRKIITREEFIALSRELGVGADWHEPDEQDVDVRLYGKNFDNAGFWGDDERYPNEIRERYIVFRKDGKPIAAANLATICAWASEPLAAPQKALTDEMYREAVQRRYTV